MKIRARLCSAAVLIGAVSFTAVSCKKEESAPTKGSAPAGVPAASETGDATVSESTGGFAARLPKSTEGFASFYRLNELWDGFANSNFVKRLMNHPVLSRELDLDSLKAEWDRNPQMQEAVALAKEIAGKEVIVAIPEGFTGNAVRLAKALGPVLSSAFTSGMQRSVKAAAGQAAVADKPRFDDLIASQSPAQLQAMLTDLTDSDVPPLLIAAKAGGAREKLDGLVKQALDSMPPDAQQVFEKTTFKADGKYEFQSVLLLVSKAMPPPEVEKMKAEFSSMTGDPVKGAALAEKVLAKTIELSWGWVDDYFVFAIGKDHSHVKLASAADSVLHVPEVSSRAAAWQAKKPLSLGYVSQKTARALTEVFGGMTDTLISLVELGAGQSPIPLDGIIADLRNISTRAKTVWPNDASAMVAASWWDAGLHSEYFGGPKVRAFDSSKPLTYGSLAGPATVFLSESRVNEAESNKVFAFFEEACATIYASYQKNIKPGLPAEMQGNIGMGEAIGIPMIKGLWKSVQDFRTSLGSESAVLVNLDGAMPDLPQVPAELKGAKIPRLLVVSDLKDRTKLSESWQGVGSVISSVIALSKAPMKAEPTEKKTGEMTSWGWELPMDTGDFWPHTAVSGTRWYLGTSPSFTSETAAKSPAPSGPACGAHARINFNAVWDYAASIVPLTPNLPEQKKNMSDILDLCRVLGELEVRTGDDNGEAHSTVFLDIRDLK